MLLQGRLVGGKMVFPVKDNVVNHNSLVIDLDDTLLRTDTLVEMIISLLFTKPFVLFSLLPYLVINKAKFKRMMNAVIDLDVETLPANSEIVSYLKEQRKLGRPIHLVTASDQSIADKIKNRFSFIDKATGSNGASNLKGKKKASYLREIYPEGFVYAGDSQADLNVWKFAAGAVLVNVEKNIERTIKKMKVPIETKFESTESNFVLWLKAMRMHQWSKNILMFAPLFLAHKYTDLSAVFGLTLGFFIFGLAASGTYILNDLADLKHDRMHRTKKNRPFAAGKLSILSGFTLANILIFASFFLMLALSFEAALVLLLYIILTLSYSLRLKSVPMLDVLVIALLFTMRLVLGAVLIKAPISEWLFSFSLFFFFSLSLAKRYVEVRSKQLEGKVKIAGRGYQATDGEILHSFGIASGIASLVVLSLYLVEDAFNSDIYVLPEVLWGVPVIICIWLTRIWLLAHHAVLDDDPVSFAIKDRISIGLGAVIAILFAVSIF